MVDVNKYREFFQAEQEKPGYWAEIAVNEFTEDLADLLKQKRLTQNEYAQLLNASPAYVSKVFNGTQNFTLATMSKLAHALGAVVHVHVARKGMIVRWIDELPCSQFVEAKFGDTVKASTKTLIDASSKAEIKVENMAWVSNG